MILFFPKARLSPPILILTILYFTNFSQRVVNQSLIALFMNDLPPISPVDQGVRDRVVAISFEYSFVSTPTTKYHKPRKEGLKERLTETKYLDAFIHLLIDCLEEWKGKDMPIPFQCSSFKDDLLPQQDVRTVLEQCYVITGNTKEGASQDYIPSSDLTQYLRGQGFEGSEQRLGALLSDVGLGKKSVRINGKVTAVRTGIRLWKEHDSDT